MRRVAASVLLPGVVLLAGCGGGRAAVSGRVTLDGVAVPAGLISFIPAEGTQSPSAGAPVSAGDYRIAGDGAPLPGVYRVEIRSQRKTGRKIPAGSPAPPGTLVEETVEAVPARYNRQSELRVEVKPGKNTFDFALTGR